MFTLALLLQAGLGLDALRAGLTFAPSGVTFALGALASRRLVARFGWRALVGGNVVTALALVVLSIVTSADRAHTPVLLIAIIVSLTGLGNGVVLPSLIGTSLVDVEPRHAGAAAGVLTTAQQFASSAGVAGVGTVFFAAAAAHPGPAGQGLGMAWSAGIGAALVLCVGALVYAEGRPNASHKTEITRSANNTGAKQHFRSNGSS